MIGLRIQISQDTATPALAATTRGLAPAALGAVIGRAGRNAVREHLFARDGQGNALGGRRTHFFGQAARATNFALQSDTVVISIDHIGIAQRYFGGVIRPKSAKYLTIPVHPSAYGKRAREFGDLEVIFGPGGQPVGLARKAKGKRTFGEVYYLLVRQATQQPDPSVLPTDAALDSAIQSEVEPYVQRLVDRDSSA